MFPLLAQGVPGILASSQVSIGAGVSPALEPHATATPLGDRFIPEEPLHEDACEVVSLGRDRETGERVVIRRLRPGGVAAQPDAALECGERYRVEYAATHGLADAHVVSAVALEDRADGQVTLVTPFVAGRTLRQALDAQGALSPEATLAFATDVSQAIAAVSRRGIVHRDIKPAHILLGDDGTARLTGFGVAQLPDDAERTQAASAHPGTPAYKSPEQATSTGYLDQRSDLYALGLVMAEALTGDAAVRGTPFADSLPPDVPASLAAVIARCLESRREDRYPSAEALLADLQRVDAESTWGQIGIVLKSMRPARQGWMAVAVLLVLLTASVWRLGNVLGAGGGRLAAAPGVGTMTPSVEVTAAPAGGVPGADPWEPDDTDPPVLSVGASQQRAFDPAGDVDRAALRVKAGATYAIRTEDLAPGVDTRLEVLVDGRSLVNDDGVAGMLSSEVIVTAQSDGVAILSVTNQGEFGPERTYRLSAVVVPATPTPMPTQTPVPTREASPTPRPTFTPVAGSPAPRPSATAGSPTATRTATPTRTPTRSLTPTLTRTPLASPTASNTPLPTRTPTPDRTPLPVRTEGPPSQ